MPEADSIRVLFSPINEIPFVPLSIWEDFKFLTEISSLLWHPPLIVTVQVIGPSFTGLPSGVALYPPVPQFSQCTDLSENHLPLMAVAPSHLTVPSFSQKCFLHLEQLKNKHELYYFQ